MAIFSSPPPKIAHLCECPPRPKLPQCYLHYTDIALANIGPQPPPRTGYSSTLKQHQTFIYWWESKLMHSGLLSREYSLPNSVLHSFTRNRRFFFVYRFQNIRSFNTQRQAFLYSTRNITAFSRSASFCVVNVITEINDGLIHDFFASVAYLRLFSFSSKSFS